MVRSRSLDFRLLKKRRKSFFCRFSAADTDVEKKRKFICVDMNDIPEIAALSRNLL